MPVFLGQVHAPQPFMGPKKILAFRDVVSNEYELVLGIGHDLLFPVDKHPHIF